MDAVIERRKLIGFPGYVVSSDGSVWSILRGKWSMLKGRHVKGGYLSVALRREDGKRLSLLVHRLVLLAFVGPCPPGFEACHRDGNPKNNCLPNLRWGTPASNYRDRVRHNTDNGGERNGSAKLTTDRVREIRRLYAAGVKRVELVKRYNMGRTTIDSIVTGKSWKQVV